MSPATPPPALIGAPPVPVATPVVVEGELRRALRSASRRSDTPGPRRSRVLALRAAPHWDGTPALTLDHEGAQIRARVATAATVLAILDVLHQHDPAADEYLVVLTDCDQNDLGDSVRAQLIRHSVQTVDRWDLVLDQWGARRLDPRLATSARRWLADALLHVTPDRRRGDPLLTEETVLDRLAAARLGRGAEENSAIDAPALLEWTREARDVERFAELAEPERAEITKRLEETVGGVARVVFALLPTGRVQDALPFALAVKDLFPDNTDAPDGALAHRVIEARGGARQRFFGAAGPSERDLRHFAAVAEGHVLRMLENGESDRVRPILDRTLEILTDLGVPELAQTSRMLEAGLAARLGSFAEELLRVPSEPAPVDLANAERAFARLDEHSRFGARPALREAALAALRLARWLATAPEPPPTLADLVAEHVRQWSWVDRALATVFAADTSALGQLDRAYARLHTAARARRAHADEAFAHELAAWSQTGGTGGELLLAENLLERLARPLAEAVTTPLVIVVDGMSAANATELAEQIQDGSPWVEVLRTDGGREGALATVPSVTRHSRASLLSGRVTEGGQAVEKAGFAQLWKPRPARLFHKDELRSDAGRRLPEAVVEAVHETRTVVGVVLNTIDDALDHGHEGGVPDWSLRDITCLPELLEEATRAGRPVLLTSDHGHVLDRNEGPATDERAASARHRTGTPGTGELLLSGPRVAGQVVVSWDERIRYTGRKAGYHGGISPAEMVIPVLALVPGGSSAPKGWSHVDQIDNHAPPWWNRPVADLAAAGAAPPVVRVKTARQEEQLFTDADLPVARSLGERVTDTELLASQRDFTRNAPDNQDVAAAVDALDAAGGRLSVAALAQAIGKPLARMTGFVALVSKLLNIDGYGVLNRIDEGRTVVLDTELLKEQFQL